MFICVLRERFGGFWSSWRQRRRALLQLLPALLQLRLIMKTMQKKRRSRRRRGLVAEGRRNKGASAATFNSQVRGCYALLWLKVPRLLPDYFPRHICNSEKAFFCAAGSIMRCWEEIGCSMDEPQSYFRLRWGWLSGFRSGGGRMGAYGMLQSCWRCQYLQGLWAVPTGGALLPTGTTGAAYWASLLQRPQSTVGPSESASQWIIYVHAATCQPACMTHFLRCTARRFRAETNISAEWKCCSAALFLCAAVNCSFVYITNRPSSLPAVFPLSHTDVFTVWLRCRRLAGRKEKKKKSPPKKRAAHSLYITSLHLTTPPQPVKNEVESVSVGLKIEIASAPLIYFISIGTHLHSWELMARISMNVKAGGRAVKHFCCFVLRWKQGGSQLQHTDTTQH